MMTLDVFNEHILKGKTVEELYELIEDFKIEKIFLKVQIERDNIGSFTLPPREMVSKMNSYRLYIRDTYKQIEKIGGTIERSVEEEFALKFQENLPNIHKIDYQIIDQFGKKEEYNLVVEESDRMNKAINKEVFLKKLSKLYMGEWRELYAASDYDQEVSDGTSWGVTVHFSDGMKSAEFGGSNAFPYNFGTFTKLIRKAFNE